MLKLISCRTCFSLQIPQSDPLHCDKDCPTRLFATYGATVRRWITGSLSSNTGLASNLTLCFHCTLPQKGGCSDAMNIHAEHVPGPPGSRCNLVNIVFQVITAMLFSPQITTAIYNAYSLPCSPNSILPLLADIPRPFPTRAMPLALRFSIHMSFSWLPIFYHSILHQIPGPSLRSRSCSQKFWHSAPFQWRP